MEKILHFDRTAIEAMPQRFRANFINSVTGYKSANLIGTISDDGVHNLAVFSSVVHLGSHPPLLGFITRPTVVPRHTYLNIKANHYFTVNHIARSFIKAAHHTAARYDETVSEFEKSELTPEFKDDFKAPFVAESKIKIACRYKNEYAIVENGTVFIIGAIEAIYLPQGIHTEDGWINLEKANGVTINGLDSYASPKLIDRLAYAKPDIVVTSILKE